ncbi:GGDEF domain-containing protein [Paenibacillus cremeus]|uniref:GGDEF domain-containing protein n=1 Tax=Paenibacillus cremeus TaxID=2163881 RepID=A0A559KDR5_9BACL|nr:GGDEF domain-containing protein [Paenibacillus cremeus]TVY10286.1 GGDEF domain-containing protein [Paenibacillus cremeus]
MKYTGRIVITVVVVVLIGIMRIYGNLYYNYPLESIPFLGIIAMLVCWWLGGQYDKVKFYAEKDILTEIYNRRFVIEMFPKIMAQMDKRNGNLILFLMDVDHFKMINDTYGHEMGDRVLQYMAKVFMSSTTKNEIVARWAGDEFLIISPFSDGTSGVIIERIQDALKALSGQLNMDVSVSIGTATYPHDAETLDALLNIADRQMYVTKARRKSLV